MVTSAVTPLENLSREDLEAVSCAPCKGAGQQWEKVPPGNWIAPPSNNRSGGGVNEAAGAFGVEVA